MTQEPEKRPSPGQVFLEVLNEDQPPEKKNQRRSSRWRMLVIPVLAVFTGLVFGAIFIILTTESVYAGFSESIGAGLRASWDAVFQSYRALFYGSIGNPSQIASALESGEGPAIRRAFNPMLESLVASTPYIFGGLAVALGFRSGVFNIGVEGQLFIGAATATFVGFAIKGIPAIIHIPLAILAGFIGGGLWGFIPGWLKAKTGGHEVINTIMMNYIAFRLTEWLLTGPMKRPDTFNPVSPFIEQSARLPVFFGPPTRLHLGFLIALGFAFLVYWFLFKTTWGFDLRTVGANTFAARYAGMNVTLNIILAMTLSGGLAGLAGANEVLGLNHNLALAFSSGYGFDSIALALLGKNHPIGVVLSALLFGTLRNGALRMQLSTGIPIDIVSILQAVILAFIAAPAIIRTIYRLRQPAREEAIMSVSGWGGD